MQFHEKIFWNIFHGKIQFFVKLIYIWPASCGYQGFFKFTSVMVKAGRTYHQRAGSVGFHGAFGSNW